MAESEKHLHFKGLVASMLLELKSEGMRVRGIQYEHEIVTKEYKTVVKRVRHVEKLKIHKIRNYPVISYLAYIPNADGDSLKILINGQTYFDRQSQNCYGTELTEDENFSVIQIKPIRKYGFNYDLDYKGMLFIVILPFEDDESYRPRIEYQYGEDIVRRKFSIFDVTCRYKRKLFKFEIGTSNHHNEKRTLVLDYDFLNNNSYLTIKRRIRRFLKKHTRVT